MFRSSELKFTSSEHKFKSVELKFNVIEHKILLGIETIMPISVDNYP